MKKVLLLTIVVSLAASAAQAAPVDWFCWFGQQLGPSAQNTYDNRPDPTFSGSTDALDYRNWMRGNGGNVWATNISQVVDTPYGNRWGFSGAGGWGQVGSTGDPNFFNPSAAPVAGYINGVYNPSTAIIGPGQTMAFPVGSSGAIGGDMHVKIAGGTLTAGQWSDNGSFSFWLAQPVSSYTSGYMYKNSVDVSNGGTLGLTSMFGFFQGGSPSAGNFTLGVHGANNTVTITDFFTAGHCGAPGYGTGTSGQGNANNGLGGGGLTLEGSGSTINIDKVFFFPSNTNNNNNRNRFSKGPDLTLILDSSVDNRQFNTVTANTLEIDSIYTTTAGIALDSPLNIEVSNTGYVPAAGDVIPVITATTIKKYDGTGVTTGVLGDFTINGAPTVSAWGDTFTLGTATIRVLDHDPANASLLGIYLEVVSVGVAHHDGDANEDGVVDLQDFGLLKENFGIAIGGGATWGQADFNADGGVDLQDFGILKDHFGHTNGDTPIAAVPEPATMSLLVLGALAMIRRNRK